VRTVRLASIISTAKAVSEARVQTMAAPNRLNSRLALRHGARHADRSSERARPARARHDGARPVRRRPRPLPGHRVVVLAEAQEAAERQDRVGDLARHLVDHEDPFADPSYGGRLDDYYGGRAPTI
jgi:hypothetical protein